MEWSNEWISIQMFETQNPRKKVNQFFIIISTAAIICDVILFNFLINALYWFY